MKTSIVILFFILFCFSANGFSQATVESCFQKPVTIFLESQDSTTNEKLESQLRNTRVNIAEDEKLFIFVYSQGSFGTQGLETVSFSVKNFARRFLLEKHFEVKDAGYKNDASVDLFLIGKDCQKIAETVYGGNPEMTLYQVDFADAPLGLSVFPKDLESRIAKKGNVDCDAEQIPDDCFGHVTFYAIVRRDGRVLYSTTLSVWAEKDYGVKSKILNRAKNALTNTVFQPTVDDGIPRYLRGEIGIWVYPRQFLKSIKKTAKR